MSMTSFTTLTDKSFLEELNNSQFNPKIMMKYLIDSIEKENFELFEFLLKNYNKVFSQETKNILFYIRNSDLKFFLCLEKEKNIQVKELEYFIFIVTTNKDLFVYLFENYLEKIHDKCINSLFFFLCDMQEIESLDYIWKNHKNRINVQDDGKNFIFNACHKNQLKIVKYFSDLLTEEIEIPPPHFSYFQFDDEGLELLIYLSENDKIDITKSYVLILTSACRKGDIRFVRYILENFYGDITFENRSYLEYACLGNRVEIVEYLCKNFFEKINFDDFMKKISSEINFFNKNTLDTFSYIIENYHEECYFPISSFVKEPELFECLKKIIGEKTLFSAKYSFVIDLENYDSYFNLSKKVTSFVPDHISNFSEEKKIITFGYFGRDKILDLYRKRLKTLNQKSARK